MESSYRIISTHSVYAVASPEACAAILWKDAGKRALAAEALKITARDLQHLGIVDEIVPEPIGGAHRDPLATAETLKKVIQKHLQELQKLNGRELREQRYQKYRQMGVVLE